jgi:hypothetical protein
MPGPTNLPEIARFHAVTIRHTDLLHRASRAGPTLTDSGASSNAYDKCRKSAGKASSFG